MSDFSLILVLQFKTSKIINGMANISIKTQEITPFGGIFHMIEKIALFRRICHIAYPSLLTSG